MTPLRRRALWLVSPPSAALRGVLRSFQAAKRAVPAAALRSPAAQPAPGADRAVSELRAAALRFSLVLMSAAPSTACGGEAQQNRDVVADVQFVGDAPDSADSAVASFGYVDFCERWADTACKVFRCEGSVPSGDLGLCLESFRDICAADVTAGLDTHIDGGALAYSAVAAEACWGPLLAAACGDLASVPEPVSCGEIVLGAAQVGAPCAFDALCAPGLFCRPGADGTCPGTCAARAADGAACDAATALCAEGSACLSTFQTGLDAAQCGKTRLAPGAPCLAHAQCFPAGFCDPQTHACAAHRASGAACASSSECATGYCSAEKVCGPLPTGGETCEYTCAEGFVCTAAAGVCVAAPTAAGVPCVAGALFPCGTHHDLQCDPATNTCVGPLPLGAACGADGQLTLCDGGYCTGDFPAAGVCAPFARVGEACEGFNACGPFMRCGSDGVCGLSGDPCRGPRVEGIW